MSFSKYRKASPPPYSAYVDSAPIRMEPLFPLLHELPIAISIKQVDLDGYDIVPPVPTHYNTITIPSRLEFDNLYQDVAKVVETQYGFTSRKSDAKRDFYFKVSLCYRLLDDEDEGAYANTRITEQNWGKLGGLLHSGKVEVAGLSVVWWKKTTAQRKADRSEEGSGGCCCVM